MIASTLSIAFLAALNDRPTHEEIIGWIDVETILLLFSMMILVAILTETGVFDHLAVYAYRVKRELHKFSQKDQTDKKFIEFRLQMAKYGLWFTAFAL